MNSRRITPYYLLLEMKSEGTITKVCILCDHVHQCRALRHSPRLKYQSHNFFTLLPLIYCFTPDFLLYKTPKQSPRSSHQHRCQHLSSFFEQLRTPEFHNRIKLPSQLVTMTEAAIFGIVFVIICTILGLGATFWAITKKDG